MFVVAVKQLQAEHALIELGAPAEVGDGEAYGVDAKGWVYGHAQQGSLPSVKFRALGSSGIEVSEISLGSWLTYSGGVAREQAEACVNAAFDAGINFIDTANVYGRGASETLLGEVLAGRERSSYVLATKVYFPMSDSDSGLSAAQIHKQIDASLQRLQTDYVDLYQCHRYDSETPLEETMEALGEVVRAGKARHIGFSEWPAEKIEESLAIPGVQRWVSSQPQYSMIWRAPEADVIPLCEREQISQIVWSPLGQGVLSGKYAPGSPPPSDSRAASDEMSAFIDRLLAPPVLEAVQRLKPVADEAGLTMVQLALAWVLREQNVASAIVGASRPEQVHANASASGIELSDETLAAVDEAFGDVVVR
jgi:aryl-alcohol dehydrogenase-like predicted oxidoreductase